MPRSGKKKVIPLSCMNCVCKIQIHVCMKGVIAEL